MDNANSKEYLDKIRIQVIENLKRTAFAPSVQMTDVPRGPLLDGMDDEADAILDDLDEDENKDRRFTKRRFDQYIEKEGELSDSEDEEELAANGIRPQPGVLKRRNQVNYRNLNGGDSGADSGLVTPREESSLPDEDAGLDEKMEDAEEVEAEAEAEAEMQDKGTPSPEEPATRSESRMDADDVSISEQNEVTAAPDAADEEEPSTSAPLSTRESIVQDTTADMDTMMDDAPPEEPTTTTTTTTTMEAPNVPEEEPRTTTTPPRKSSAADAPPPAALPAATSPPAQPAQPTPALAEPAGSAETATETASAPAVTTELPLKQEEKDDEQQL